MDLLNRFKPRIVFDSREIFFPSSVEYYLANSESDEKKISISDTDNLDMDNILDRINQVGIENLTKLERKFLDNYKV